jgi:hypothetical protein
VAKLSELNPSFVDGLKNGSYKGRSISLYDDNRVRHLGFLGGAQPAIEGLMPLSYKENGEHFKLYEFQEINMDEIKEMKKKLAWYDKVFSIFHKDIDKEFKETNKESPMEKVDLGNETLPSVAVDGVKDHIESASVTKMELGTPDMNGPEIEAKMKDRETEDKGVLETSKVQAAEAKNDANSVAKENEELKSRIQYLENQLATLQKTFGKESQTTTNDDFCEQMIKEGRMRPVDKEMHLLALNSMKDIDKINAQNFTEPQPSRLEKYRSQLKTMPKVIEFGEFPALAGSEKAQSFPNTVADSNLSFNQKVEAKMAAKMAEKDKLGLTSKVSYDGWESQMMKDCMAECAKEDPKAYAEFVKSWIPSK